MVTPDSSDREIDNNFQVHDFFIVTLSDLLHLCADGQRSSESLNTIRRFSYEGLLFFGSMIENHHSGHDKSDVFERKGY